MQWVVAHCCWAALGAVARWGKVAHLTFFFFCILTNILVTSMLLLGGAAVINALTGMNIYAVRYYVLGLGLGSGLNSGSLLLGGAAVSAHRHEYLCCERTSPPPPSCMLVSASCCRLHICWTSQPS